MSFTAERTSPLPAMVRHMLRARLERRYQPQRLWRVAQRRLAALVRFAKAAAPLYAELYRDIDPDNFRLEQLPPVTKEQMMGRFEDTLTVRDLTYKQVLEFVEDKRALGRLLAGRYVAAHTSGTTGVRGYFVNTLAEWTQTIALTMTPPGKVEILPLWDQLLTFPIRPFKRWRAISIIATGGHYASPLAYMFAPAIKDRFADIRVVDLFTPLHEMARIIDEFRPLWVHSYPSVLQALAQEALAGRLRHRPRLVYGASEPFPQEVKDLLGRAWPGVLIDELYGTTECLHLAKPCPAGRLHFNADWAVVEPVDDECEPVPAGEFGRKLLVTNLVNRTQPVIRYELSDAVRFLPDPCPCGGRLPTIEVIGRANDAFEFPGEHGVVRVLALPILVTFLDVPGLKQYRATQTAPLEVVLEYAVEPGADGAVVAAACEAALRKRLHDDGAPAGVQISTRRVDQLERDPVSGKFKQVQRLF